MPDLTPDAAPRQHFRFLQSEYIRLQQSQLEQQRLNWELLRLELDLQILQAEQLWQQQELDQQLEAALDSERREILAQQRAEIEQHWAELREFREQLKQSRELFQQPNPQTPFAPEEINLVEQTKEKSNQAYSLDQDNEPLTAWERYCLWHLEKPDGVHTRMWEESVVKATGEQPSPQIDTPDQWHEYRASLQPVIQPEPEQSKGMER